MAGGEAGGEETVDSSQEGPGIRFLEGFSGQLWPWSNQQDREEVLNDSSEQLSPPNTLPPLATLTQLHWKMFEESAESRMAAQ